MSHAPSTVDEDRQPCRWRWRPKGLLLPTRFESSEPQVPNRPTQKLVGRADGFGFAAHHRVEIWKLIGVPAITCQARCSLKSPGPTWPGPDGDGGGGGGGGAVAAVSGSAGSGAVGSVRFRNVSLPDSGPRQVVPEYGIVSVWLSTIVPVPLNENGQVGTPGRLAVPLAITGTWLPFNDPEIVPETVSPPGHWSENVPAIELAV